MTHRYFDGRYFRVKKPEHPKAHKDGYVYEHILEAEKKLGRFLTKEEEVHHKDRNKKNNDHGNLEVCASHSEHMEIERRQRALAACGNPDWYKCGYCGVFDAPSNLYMYLHRGFNRRGHHAKCKSDYNKKRWELWKKK